MAAGRPLRRHPKRLTSMSYHRGQLPNDSLPVQPMEEALRELAAAEKAGVFQPTRVDAGALLRESAGRAVLRPRVFTLRLVAAAAVILIAVCLWGWVFSPGSGPNGESGKVASRPVETQVVTAATLSECVTGPMDFPKAACTSYDYDADGDVDLVDISSYQLAYAGVSR